MIWDNIGLEKEDRNIPTYQLMADVFEKLDIHSGTVFNYHQQRRQSKQYLADLELLQYDMLYGNAYVYGGLKKKPTWEDTLFQMGILDVTISGIQANLDGTYSFYGDNLTANSKVYVNGEKQDTQFLNNTRIELRECELQEGDSLVVNQVGSSNRVFRSTDEFIYSQGKLVPASEYIPMEGVEPKATDLTDSTEDTRAVDFDDWETPEGATEQ